MTATQRQVRRGTAAQLATFTGAAGEVVVDTTNDRVVVCDGSTVGGFPAAKLSEVPGLTSYQGSGFVNRFRNPNFDIAQRGTSGTVTTSGAYTLDGWIVTPTGASISWQQGVNGTAGTTPPSGSDYFLFLSGAAGITDVVVKQRIEGSVAAAFAGRQVTVQLAVNAGMVSPPVPTLTVKHATVQDNWSGAATDVSGQALQSLITNAWKVLAYTFTAPAAAGNGLEISFDFGALASGSLAITQADIRATPGVATGLNSSPPLPELRPVAIELLFCQRYFQTFGTGKLGGIGTSTIASVGGSYPAVMRATPTLMLTSSTPQIAIPGVGFVTASGSTLTLVSSNASGFYVALNGFSGLVAPNVVVLQSDCLTGSAEL